MKSSSRDARRMNPPSWVTLRAGESRSPLASASFVMLRSLMSVRGLPPSRALLPEQNRATRVAILEGRRNQVEGRRVRS